MVEDNKNRHRGHVIVEKDMGNWDKVVYEDTGENVYEGFGNDFHVNERPCVHCGKMPSPGGHDACIANLPGVDFACCGHGGIERGYISFKNGVIIRGIFEIEYAEDFL